MRTLVDTIIVENIDLGYEIANLLECTDSGNRYEVDIKNHFPRDRAVRIPDTIELSVYRRN